MAERYSGKATTHGAVAYWLDTLMNAVRSDPSMFQGDIQRTLQDLWFAVQSDMQRLNVNALGMPRHAGEMDRLVIGVDLFPLYAGTSGGIVPWVKGVLRGDGATLSNGSGGHVPPPGPPPHRH